MHCDFGEHMSSALCPKPHVPIASLQNAHQGNLCRLLLPKKLFLHSLSLPTLPLPSLGP